MSERVLEFSFEKNSGQRLDKFLVEQLPEFSRSRLQVLIADGFVNVNGNVAKKAGQIVEQGQQVIVRIPPAVPSGLVAEEIPLHIIFENEDLLVINKPA